VARIVLNTFGSFGDLHPYLAVAIGLRQRGHDAIVATSEVYRSKVEGEGVGFHPVRPDVGELSGNDEFIRKLWHPRLGTEYLLREYILPQVDHAYEDLRQACEDADLLLTHAVGYAGPIVAEVLNLPWLSIALQPAVFLSAYDPPVLAPAPWLRSLRLIGPRAVEAVFSLGRRMALKWTEPIAALRQRLGLPQANLNPIFEGQFSPMGTVALFSAEFAPPQPDWPADVVCTGFPFYDRESSGSPMDPGLAEFLAIGPPPVVFTLGSSAVMAPGQFFEESMKAAHRLGVRAVLLVGAQSMASASVSKTVYAARYAPFSELLPRASVVVHQGGIGTTAQTLRAGRPMLVVPWAHDQPDNAHRISRLGVGRRLNRRR
jgi:rhamnosyltransferase subunit B